MVQRGVVGIASCIMKMTMREALTLDALPGFVDEKNRNELQRETVRVVMTERNEDNNDRRGSLAEIFECCAADGAVKRDRSLLRSCI